MFFELKSRSSYITAFSELRFDSVGARTHSRTNLAGSSDLISLVNPSGKQKVQCGTVVYVYGINLNPTGVEKCCVRLEITIPKNESINVNDYRSNQTDGAIN